MRRALLALLLTCLGVGCSEDRLGGAVAVVRESGDAEARADQRSQTLSTAREGFVTRIVDSGEDYGPPEEPPAGVFELVRYEAPLGELAAYVTPDPGDGKRRPAIIWITGGDNNSIGDVWSRQSRENDQSVPAFRRAGLVTMFPSQRGGNDNPGRREGFFGEVDDVIAAADYLAGLPYVDAGRIYLGGHSTGGTLAMLVGECTDRFRAVFALGPVASPSQYGGSYVYHDESDQKETELRSPYLWLDSVRSPMYVIEGINGNWEGACELMSRNNTNPQVRIYAVAGHDHFSVISPVTELLAKQILDDRISVTQSELDKLE